jgi:hypothetical protein
MKIMAQNANAVVSEWAPLQRRAAMKISIPAAATFWALAVVVSPADAQTGNSGQRATAAGSGVGATQLRAAGDRATAQLGGGRLRAVTAGMRAPDGPHPVHAKPTDDSRRAAEPVVIDLMIAYTRNAAAHYADLERDLVHPAIEEANASFAFSGLGHIKLRLVHAYQTPYQEEGLHFDHLWRFADKGDGQMEEVHDLRELYRADIAVLIVDDPKGCGLATRVHADADEAFAVVHHKCVATSYTLAHEIGHLIGASHELAFVNGTKWRDIMGSKESCGGCPRIPYWSNPSVRYRGEPTGTAAYDNARVIFEQAGRVSRFK